MPAESSEVVLARLDERTRGLERDMAEVVSASNRNADMNASINTDLRAFMGRVDAHIQAEDKATATYIGEHERRHDRDTARVHWIIGIGATASVAVATALGYMLR
ncbi:MAG: hypothetical protein ACREB9_04805 [Thermoplasmata archaeon]